MLIQFDTDIERSIDLDQMCLFSLYLDKKYRENHRDEIFNPYSKIYSVRLFINRMNCQFIDENLLLISDIEKLNTLNENYKLRPNMNCGKAIGKICREEGWDKFEGFNKEYAKLCDALNPLKVTRHTVISLNPIDYLLMSNGNSWSSCHDIVTFGRGSCHSSGTISYMLDRNSFIFYTVDKNYNGIDIELQPKIQRQVFGYNNGYLAQSRLYPQSNDAGAKEAYKNIRAIVQNVITDCLGVANLWEKYNGDIEDIVWKNTHATCYPDWENNSPGASCCTVTYIKELETNPHREIELGEEPICIECGCRHDHDESLYSCEIVQCAECGTWIFEDDEIYINGESYCADCITECNCCGEWKPNYVLTEIDGDWVCPDCMEYSGGLLEMLRMW